MDQMAGLKLAQSYRPGNRRKADGVQTTEKPSLNHTLVAEGVHPFAAMTTPTRELLPDGN
jgi:hypothetical protein